MVCSVDATQHPQGFSYHKYENLTHFDGILMYSDTTGSASGSIGLTKTHLWGVSTATATTFPTQGHFKLTVIHKYDGTPLMTKGRVLFDVVAPEDSAAASYYDYPAIYKHVHTTVMMTPPTGYEATTNLVHAQFTEDEIAVNTSSKPDDEMIVYIRKIRDDIPEVQMSRPRGVDEARTATEQQKTTPQVTVEVAPTPFNEETEIRYTLPENGYVHLEIYRFVRRFALLVNTRQEAGKQVIRWRPSPNLASGVYLVRLTFTNDRGEVSQQIEKLEYVK